MPPRPAEFFQGQRKGPGLGRCAMHAAADQMLPAEIDAHRRARAYRQEVLHSGDRRFHSVFRRRSGECAAEGLAHGRGAVSCSICQNGWLRYCRKPPEHAARMTPKPAAGLNNAAREALKGFSRVREPAVRRVNARHQGTPQPLWSGRRVRIFSAETQRYIL